MLRFRIRPTVLGQSAEGYVNEYMKAHTQVTGEVEDARGDEVVEVGSGSGCPWLSQVRHLETSCLVASTAKSTMERLIPGCELAQLTINQIIWRSRTLELAVNTVVCLAVYQVLWEHALHSSDVRPVEQQLPAVFAHMFAALFKATRGPREQPRQGVETLWREPSDDLQRDRPGLDKCSLSVTLSHFVQHFQQPRQR